MNISPLLYAAFKELQDASKGALTGTKIESISGIINKYAIYSAVAQMASLAGGIGSVVALLTQTGLIWTTYVKINKELGVSMSENTMKFIGSAVLTNLIANAGIYLVAMVTAWLIGMIPVLNFAAIAVEVVIAYVLIYASALIYLKLLTEVMRAKGSYELEESEDTKDLIKKIVKDTDIKGVVKEGRDAFKEAKDSGELERIKNDPECYNCGKKITGTENFCSSCGAKLK
jgi:hypothetical protein